MPARYTLLLATLVALVAACGIFRRPRRSGQPSGPRWIALLPATDGGVAPVCPAQSVFIPGGSFQMGSPDGQGAADERPRHRVNLSPYCLDRTEVTIASYTRCVTQRACTRASATLPQEDLPVSNIDWQQADAYCRFVGGRLPSEAEWEYAARGTDARVYPWGNEPPTNCDRLDWTVGLESCRGVGPSRVGSAPGGASPFGIQDMAGNVWEWTADWYAPQYPAGDETDPSGPEQGSARVTRGGGWNNDQADKLRAAWREGQHPAVRGYDLGVRCAYDPGNR